MAEVLKVDAPIKHERKLKILDKGFFFSWRDLTFFLFGAWVSLFIGIMLVI